MTNKILIKIGVLFILSVFMVFVWKSNQMMIDFGTCRKVATELDKITGSLDSDYKVFVDQTTAFQQGKLSESDYVDYYNALAKHHEKLYHQYDSLMELHIDTCFSK